MVDGSAPWLDGFDAFRAKEIDPLVAELEEARKAARAAARGRALWVVPLALAVIGIAFWLIPVDFALIAGLVAGGMAWAYIQSPVIDHQKEVKGKLVGRLCAFFGLDFAPEPGRDPIPELRRVGLLPGHNREAKEDQVSGVYQGVRLEMTDLHLRNVSGSGKNKRDVTVFRGPVLCFSFPKRFNGTTIIKPDGSLIGNWLGGFGMGDKERVRLEDPEFEACFEVYGTDQVEARYLLTPAFMQYLMQLRRGLGKRMQAAFSGESLYIVANNNQNRFEIRGYSASGINEQLDSFIADLDIVFSVIRTLNLTSTTRL